MQFYLCWICINNCTKTGAGSARFCRGRGGAAAGSSGPGLWAVSRVLLQPQLHSSSRICPAQAPGAWQLENIETGAEQPPALPGLAKKRDRGWESPSPIFIKLEWLMSSMEITPRARLSSLASPLDRLQELSTIKKLLLKNKAIERFAPFWKILSRAWSCVWCEEELLSLPSQPHPSRR